MGCQSLFAVKYLLGQNLFQLGKAGEGVLLGQVRLTLDQGQSILNKLMIYAGAILVDPGAGNLFFHIGHLHQGYQLGLTGVASVQRRSCVH